jgi:hypothetical protein
MHEDLDLLGVLFGLGVAVALLLSTVNVQTTLPVAAPVDQGVN